MVAMRVKNPESFRDIGLCWLWCGPKKDGEHLHRQNILGHSHNTSNGVKNTCTGLCGLECGLVITWEDLHRRKPSLGECGIGCTSFIVTIGTNRGKEKAAFFTMLDALVSKKKLKDNLTSALQLSA